jgi:hypothetical protein
MSKQKQPEQDRQLEQAPEPMLTVHRARQAAMLGISHAWRKAGAKEIPSDNAPGMLRKVAIGYVLDEIRAAAEANQ